MSTPSMPLDRVPTEAFIGGGWRHNGRTFAVHSPTIGREIALVVDCGVDEARMAADSAVDAMRNWSRATGFERAQVLHEWSRLIANAAEQLAQLTTLEMGKTIREARSESEGSADQVAWYAEEAKRVHGEIVPSRASNKRLLVLRQPVGPVFGITPWNFPISMITRKAAPALAAGCPFILKPAEQTPLSALLLARLWEEAGGPPGTFQVLPTNRPAEIAEPLMADSRIRKLTFTGSTEVGRLLYGQAARTIKRVSLELGGHAPFLVFEDADLQAAARDTVTSKFRNAGQTCISTNRLYVHRAVASEFTDALAREVSALKVGDPRVDETDIGPLVNLKGFEKVNAHVHDARMKGAQLITGGEGDGLVFQPTMLTCVQPDMRILSEETFGPVLPISMFESEEEAVRLANNSRYGLAAYFWTRSASRIFRVSEALDYGIIGANDGRAVQMQAPFGGLKESGVGREGGRWALEEYLDVKYVSVGVGDGVT